MKKTTLLATVLLLGASATAVGAATNNQFQGSDTLKDMTKLVLNTCAAASGLDYLGGGSGTGENGMAAGSQEIAPMSRLMGAGACLGGQAISGGQGLVVAHDGLAITTDGDADVEDAVCASGQINQTGSFTVKKADGTDFIDCPGCDAGTATYTFKSPPTAAANGAWKDVLRIIYSGLLHDGAALTNGTRDCAGQVRKSLLSNYAALFEGGCSALGECTGGLNHAFRRDDLSGTTDTFITLVGLPALSPTTFCNGTEQQDNDPVRRACATKTCAVQADCDADGGGTCVSGQATFKVCSGKLDKVCTVAGDCTGFGNCVNAKVCAGNEDEDDVCDKDNQLGVVLPVFAPPDPDTTVPANGTGDVPTVDTYYSMDVCPASNGGKLLDCGRFTDATDNSLHFQCPDRPDADEFNIAGGTVVPITDAGLPCLCDTDKAKCKTVFTKANTGLPFMDHRVFNLFVRSNSTSGKTLINRPPGTAATAKVNLPGQGNARIFNLMKGFFRLKSSKAKPALERCALNVTTTACVTTADCGAQAISEGSTCQAGFCTTPNSDTRNIGCLAAETDCSIGYAGKESATAHPDTKSLLLAKTADGTPVALTDATALDLSYPLARKLFINSIKGFANVVDAKEAGLMGNAVGCYGNLTTVQAAATKSSFVPAPFSCVNFNETTCNTKSCATATQAKDCKAAAGSTCSAGDCTCTGDTDCLGGRTCTAGLCKYATDSAPECTFCNVTADCAAGKTCVTNHCQ